MEIDGVYIHEADLKALDAIECLTKNVQKVQDQVLSTILRTNRSTEYLSRFRQPAGENGNLPRTASDSEDDALGKEWFKKMVPVVGYEDVEPYISRLVHHDPISTNNVLCAHPITELLRSSGTSGGERKLIPTIAEDRDRRHFFLNLLLPVMNQYSPGLAKGKGLYFISMGHESKTPSGLVARPVTTSYLKSARFKQELSKSGIYTTPIEAIMCPDLSQSIYCQLLCGLVLKDEVVRMGAPFATGFLRAIRFLEENWACLCHDIHEGQLNPKITHAPMRAAVMKLLSIPNPALAESIQMECSKGSWQGIIGRIWKRARFIDSIVTGTMSQYIPMLDYYSGGLPLVCSNYGSSECFFGINLKPFAKPSEVSYTFLPNMGYFEFISIERSNDGSNIGHEISELADVELGKEYEILVTTYAGLYRYKVGDVVRVTGFHNQAPQFAFVQRKKVVLSVDLDKTDEKTLHQAIQNASKLLEYCSKDRPLKVLDYTSRTNVSSFPGHYVVFWEIHGAGGRVLQELIPASLLEDCCLCIEESLDALYRQIRNLKESTIIDPLEIRVVKHGTFDALMDYFVSQVGASINQYKTPRCIKSSIALSMLDANVLQSSRSPRSPSWALSSSIQEL